MEDTNATRILNLLGLIATKNIDTEIPQDLQNPRIYKYITLYTSVYAKPSQSSYSIQIIDDDKAHGDKIRLATEAEFFFSKEMKEAIEALQTELIEKELLSILDKNTDIVPKVIKHATKRIKYVSRDFKGKTQQVSLINLESILNNSLARQITKNMGSGFSKNVLNYRSGRFANTAHIKHLQMQRDGAIAVFYTYMKYPYQTFEPGFNQSYPPSRDPTVLISKSIREIAVNLVENRLRMIRE